MKVKMKWKRERMRKMAKKKQRTKKTNSNYKK
jgi:hypothetical protein